jgi:N utilization substance protein B
MGRVVAGPRRQAREAALQILYFWEIGHVDPETAIDVFFTEHARDAPVEVETFAEALVRGTVERLAAIDATIARHSAHWRFERLAIIDRLVLRLGTWELQEDQATPPAVVINEAIELARRYGGDESARFVNGVLDAIRQGTADRGQEAGHRGQGTDDRGQD